MGDVLQVRFVPPGESEEHLIEVDLLGLSLSERDRVRRDLAVLIDEPDVADMTAAFAWVVWLRGHPGVTLAEWLDNITLRDVLGLADDDVSPLVETPADADPE